MRKSLQRFSSLKMKILKLSVFHYHFWIIKYFSNTINSYALITSLRFKYVPRADLLYFVDVDQYLVHCAQISAAVIMKLANVYLKVI